jgi:hypothetical protein
MKPRKEKMTVPANMEVQEFTVQTISASWKEKENDLEWQAHFVDIVVVFVIRAEGDDSAEAKAVGEEDLQTIGRV